MAVLQEVRFAYDTRAAIADIRAKLKEERADKESEPSDSKSVGATPPAAPSPAEPDSPMVSTGSGIAVSSAQGQILTNHHVIDGCHDIAVRRGLGAPGHASLLYDDAENDLALLKSDIVFSDGEEAMLRMSPLVRNGEEIAVYGYPLPELLSTSGNITRGNVSSLAGVGDDQRMLQITAPIQPGNSGGPLLDQSG